MSYIFWPEHPGLSLDECGGKALALWKLQNVVAPLGASVPDWFVLSRRAFHDTLTDEQRAALFNTDVSTQDMSTQQTALAALRPLSPISDAGYEVLHAMLRLCPRGESVAVRSSARDEDGAQHSFAGQFHTALCVPSEGVSKAILDVWLSAWNENNRAYRAAQNIGEIHVPAVLVQQMINAEAAGVAFSADPVSGQNDVCVVSAVHGLGSALVDGSSDADEFRVRDDEIIERKIAAKNIAHRPMPDGVRVENSVEGIATAPALSDEQVVKIARLTQGVAEHFGMPQDIEWAMENGKIYLLQARPITTLRVAEEKLAEENCDTAEEPALVQNDVQQQGEFRLWDNSNIIESYPGITSPLTFSFARQAYQEVYRQFCSLLGVSSQKIKAHDSTFAQMLGLIQGRVYYNLLNWYRLLQLLPGFRFNRRFMEQMMGVRETLPDEVLNLEVPATQKERVLDGLQLLRNCLTLIWNYATLERCKEKFYARVEDALQLSTQREAMSTDELARHYRDLQSQLLSRWDAPLLNDFFTMIFHGVLRKLCTKWCGDENLSNALLSGEGDMVSIEPLRRMRELAQLAAHEPAFVEKLTNASWPELKTQIAARAEWNKAFESYLDCFGERCFEELKLESPTLRDDPLPLLRGVAHMARDIHPAQVNAGLALREDAEAQLESLWSLPLNNIHRIWKKPLFRWVLQQTRERVRDRENLRFERTRVFGRVRRIFVEIGKRLHETKVLDSPQDVFYLETEEVLGFIEGTATVHRLNEFAQLRRRDYQLFEKQTLPDRFSTERIVAMTVLKDQHDRDGTHLLQSDDDARQGTGCCAGVVRGRARVVLDPKGEALHPGEILVAPRTDPGWVILFAGAAGLVVERGSLLSHSAIVAREMGLPAVVALPDVTTWLNNGDLIEINGKTGRVQRLEKAGRTI
jgi:rifampicin phosphotransferase